MIQRVVKEALASAVASLPPGGFGIRCHVLPLETALDACLEGVDAFLAERPLAGIRCVVGTTCTASAAHREIAVHSPETAAALVTALRNTKDAQATTGLLIYLCSVETAQESGLQDVLSELRTQDIALAFARASGLGVLEALAASRARAIRDRFLYSTVTGLGEFHRIAVTSGEALALPALGFLPPSLVDVKRPSADWASDYEALLELSVERRAALSAAATKLGQLNDKEREAVAAWLRRAKGAVPTAPVPDADLIAATIGVLKAILALASGRQPTADRLAGANRTLLDMLAATPHLEAVIAGTDDGDDDDEGTDGDDGDPPVDGDEDAPAAIAEEHLLLRDGAPALQCKRLQVTQDDRFVELTLAREDGTRQPLVGRRVGHLLADALRDTPELWTESGALQAAPEGAIVGGEKVLNLELRYPPHQLGELSKELTAAIAAFHRARADLLGALAAAVEAPEAAEEFSAAELAVLVLEAFPLTATANAMVEVQQYLDAYGTLMALAFSDDCQLSAEAKLWLMHVDVAFTLGPNQSATVARLLPLHPLRLARFKTWLSGRSAPPPYPATLALTPGFQIDRLMPHAESGCYHSRPSVTPTREGLVAAATAGIRAAWSVLAHHRLLGALDIELVDVATPSAVIAALYQEVRARFNDDARAGEGVHLRVRCARSQAGTPGSEYAPPRAQALDEIAPGAAGVPGSGVTLEVLPTLQQVGASPVHLSLRAMDAVFVGLAPGIAPGHWDVRYVPGASGNIRAVEVTGDSTLDAYRGLLRSSGIDLLAGFDPGAKAPAAAHALFKTYVARGGWPVKPSEAESLFSYDLLTEHVVATLVDTEVFDADLIARLGALSGAAEDLPLAKIRDAIVALYPCRNFLANVAEEKDERHLRGWLGLLRAFAGVKERGADTKVLGLSLDGQEGQTWAALVASHFGGQATRCDLIILEADAANRVTHVRAVELKARASSGALSSAAHRASLAAQAVVTAARLRACLSADPGTQKPVIEALRRLLWIGAGQQRLAQQWKEPLTTLDLALSKSGAPGADEWFPPKVTAECWLVPEQPWNGKTPFEQDVADVTAAGEPTGNMVSVSFDVLTAGAPPAPIAPPPGPTSAPIPPPPPPPPPDAAEPVSESVPPVEVAPPHQAAARPEDAPVTPAPPPTPPPAPAPAPAPHTPPQPPAPPPAQAPSADPYGMRIRFGTILPAATTAAIWLPNHTDLVTHFNVGITGTMGSGKTQFTKSFITQIIERAADNPGGKAPGILIFDYKGDYLDTQPGGFAHRVGATVLQPSNLPINPLRIGGHSDPLKFKVALRLIAETIRTISPGIGEVQRLALINAITACLHDFGIDPSTPATWTRPFPTIKDLYARILADGKIDGTPLTVLSDLAELDVFASPDPGFNTDALFDGITVIDLTPLAGSTKVSRAIIAFFMDAMYARMIAQGESLREQRASGGAAVELRQLRRLLLVDEADDFMSLGLSSLKNIMQQGRSFGHAVVLSTQFLHHFDNSTSPLKPLIGTWILHRMANVTAQTLKSLFGLSGDEAQEVAATLNALEVHTSLCQGLSNDKASRSRLIRIQDLPFFKLPPKL